MLSTIVLARRYDDYAAFKAGVKELELMTATAMRTALSDAPGLRLQLEALAVSSLDAGLGFQLGFEPDCVFGSRDSFVYAALAGSRIRVLMLALGQG